MVLALVLSGCSAAFRIGQQTPILAPQGSRIIEQDGETVIEPSPPQVLCQARARHFRGTVSVPCDEIARQIAP